LGLNPQFFKERIREGLPRASERPASAAPDKSAPFSSARTLTVDVAALLSIRNDDDFIREAYRLMLGRECDIVGFVNYREMIRRHVPRRQILRTLARSPEAKKTGRQFVNVPAHGWLQTDLLGRITEAAGSIRRGILFGIKHVVRTVFLDPVEVLEHKVDFMLEEVGNRFDGVSAKVDGALWTISQKLDSQFSDGSRLWKSNNERAEALAARVKSLEERQRELGEENRRLAAGLETRLESIHGHMRPPVLSGGDVFFTEVDDFIVGVPGEEKRLAAYFVFRGLPEPGLAKLFGQTVKPGMVVLDIGAHIGLYTLQAARLLRGAGKVYSFEPTPRTFELLKDNIQVNGFLESGIVVLKRAAVADKAGTASFSVYATNSGHNSLFAGEAEGSPVVVETVAGDDELAGEASVDVVKIDVEGAEPLVLRGLAKTIERNPRIRIFMEFAPVHLRRGGIDPGSFLEEIQAMNFEINRVDDVTGELLPYRPQELRDCFSANLSLRRRGSAA
jgi:FkbM family methyltransferase